MPCVRADGNDLFAMTKVMKDAVRELVLVNPTFIEAVTYRLRDHTTADDAGVSRCRRVENGSP